MEREIKNLIWGGVGEREVKEEKGNSLN